MEAPNPWSSLAGARLRAARTDAGLSLAELADRIGASPSFLSQLENGHRAPSLGLLLRLCRLLAVTPDDLLLPLRDGDCA